MILFSKRLLRIFTHKKQKQYDDWIGKEYLQKPLISFIIQTHNKSDNVIQLVKKLTKCTNSEIIVIDDGSKLNHSIRLIKSLTLANNFILRCNDLYEVITYDKAIKLANGEYLALLQDDDDFENLIWIDNAIAIFKSDEKLAILGGRDGAKLLPYPETSDGMRGKYLQYGDILLRDNSFKIQLEKTNTDRYKYVQYVDRAPMWIKKSLFDTHLNHLDITYAPFQWDDAEICLRTWSKGLHVALYNANFSLGAFGIGGMQTWNKVLHERQDEVNVKKVYSSYKSVFDEINQKIEALNNSLHYEL